MFLSGRRLDVPRPLTRTHSDLDPPRSGPIVTWSHSNMDSDVEPLRRGPTQTRSSLNRDLLLPVKIFKGHTCIVLLYFFVHPVFTTHIGPTALRLYKADPEVVPSQRSKGKHVLLRWEGLHNGSRGGRGWRAPNKHSLFTFSRITLVVLHLFPFHISPPPPTKSKSKFSCPSPNRGKHCITTWTLRF